MKFFCPLTSAPFYATLTTNEMGHVNNLQIGDLKTISKSHFLRIVEMPKKMRRIAYNMSSLLMRLML